MLVCDGPGSRRPHERLTQRGTESRIVLHSGRGSQGGFKRSSQHLMIMKVWGGSSSAGS